MAISAISYLGLKTCRYLLKISYIGTKYKGVQRLTRRNDNDKYDEEDGSIQCAIENAINRALCPVYGSRLALSSRTDAGVHAYQNYANVDLTHPFVDTIYKPSFITDTVNRVLAMNDHEITLLESRLVPSYFHSRINAKWRTYVYRFAVIGIHKMISTNTPQQVNCLRACLPVSQINRCHIISSIDIELVKACIEMFNGEHDFASFSTKDKAQKDKSTIKNMELEFRRCYPLTDFELRNKAYSQLVFYELHLKSKSFLYNQVRRMVSAIIDVGLRRLTLLDIEKMLTIPYYRPACISQMVPACGLYLTDVGYDESDLTICDNYMEYAPKANYREYTFDYDFESIQ